MCVCAVLFRPTERDTSQSKDDRQEDDCEWTVTLQPHTESVDAVMALPLVQPLTLDLGQQPIVGSLSSDASSQADSSTPPSSVPQVITRTIQIYTTGVALLQALTSFM